jgi:shikimate dehydrogenase
LRRLYEEMPVVVSASTALCGIVLHPAGHTRSPALHNAAYEALGLDAHYVAFDVPAPRLEGAMIGIRALGIRQISVSIPHKTAVLDLVDAVDETARRIGAANTVVLEGDRLVASNTDWLGAIRALEREHPLEGARATVLGAGGTARAVVWGLLQRGAEVRVLNRSIDRASALARELGAKGAGALEAISEEPYDVLVNTTSVGMGGDDSPIAAAEIRRDAVVLDAVYAPEMTRLLRDARARGARIVSGRWMLVYQAVAQIEAWAGAIDAERATRAMAEAFGPQPA